MRDGEDVELSTGNLLLRGSRQPDGDVLDEFFEGYDRVFILPSEKETLDGFRKCLALNVGDTRRRLGLTFGPFSEFVVTAHQGGAFVGGANFICFPLDQEGASSAISINLNYVFVLPEHRGRGYLRTLTDGVRAIANREFPSGRPDVPRPTLVFLEMNDPLLMDGETYKLESEHSGMDQMQRIAMWGSAGARIIDFPYVQPPLSSDQSPDHGLLYAVIGADGRTLPAALLHSHLFRFFGISVLKGVDPATDPVAEKQLSDLRLRARSGLAIDLLDPGGAAALQAKDARPGMSIRDMLRAAAPAG